MPHGASKPAAILLIASALFAPIALPREGAAPRLCQALKTFAAAEKQRGLGEVELQRQGSWMVDHVKACARKDDDPAAIEFCKYLLEHTSTEFLEATINEAMACLQGQKIKGYLGNTGIRQWDGKVEFFSTGLGVDGIEASMQWHMTAGFGAWDDYLRITIAATR